MDALRWTGDSLIEALLYCSEVNFNSVTRPEGYSQYRRPASSTPTCKFRSPNIHPIQETRQVQQPRSLSVPTPLKCPNPLTSSMESTSYQSSITTSSLRACNLLDSSHRVGMPIHGVRVRLRGPLGNRHVLMTIPLIPGRVL
jgi:hypothetical protein